MKIKDHIYFFLNNSKQLSEYYGRIITIISIFKLS